MIRILAGLSGLAALGFAGGSILGPVPAYLPVAAVVLAGLLFLSAGLPRIMRFLIGLFALAFLALGATTAANEAGFVPEAALPYLPPAHAAIVAAILALVNVVICYIPMIRHIIDLAAPYFETEEKGDLHLGILGSYRLPERWIGLGMFGIVIAINVAQVYMNVLFSFWNNRFYSALQDKNLANFWTETLYFSIVATIWIIAAVYEYVLSQTLDLRWRRWMSVRYLERWIDGGVHYRMRLAGDEADNPDQRISEDVRDFVTYSRSFYIQLFSALLNLYAFVQILWGLSFRFPYSIGGFDLATIPGYLVWFALSFAVLATVGTHIIGRPLVSLNFLKQRYEADFRFNLVRVRENSEEIALLHGETAERSGLMGRFRNVIDVTLALINRQKKVTWFTAAYSQASVLIPFILLAPAYFSTADMKLGDLTQTAGAFGNVQDAFSIFVTLYTSLAVYKSVINRLRGFETAIVGANAAIADGLKVDRAPGGGPMAVRDLDLHLPGGRPLLAKASVAFRPGERTLVTGPSGAGKTTLFRALAGIWPFGTGHVEVPAGEEVMVLPQHAYLPLGTLRAALAYPSEAHSFPDEAIRTALATVGLSALADRLDTAETWSNSLSGGEKQRVAVVRALLRKPAWLLLDEATSALDETAEAVVYQALREALPRTTIVSIGHRSSLAALHDRRVTIETGEGGSRIVDAPIEAFGPAGA